MVGKSLSGVTLAAGFLFAGSAFAITSEPYAFQLNSGNWTPTEISSITSQVPKFDPALGTLESVKVTLLGKIQTAISIDAVTNLTINFMYTNASITVAPTGMSYAAGVTSVLTAGFNRAQDSKITPIAVLAGKGQNLFAFTTDPNTASQSADTSYTDTAILSLFKGVGSLSLNIYTNPPGTAITSQVGTGGNFVANQTTSGQADGTVTYTYSHMAVPEATTLLLGLAGGMPLLMHRGRRRATKA